MKLNMAFEIADERKGIEKQFRALFADEFKGLVQGTHYVDDLAYMRFYHQQMQQRPNYEQMLCLAKEGKADIRRFWRAMGAPEMAELVIQTYGALTEEASDGIPS